MTTAFVSAISTAAEAWKIMRDDVALRHSRIAKVFHEQLQRDIRGLNSEEHRKGNVGYYLPARIEVEIRHTNECAQALYEACCGVWDVHKLPKTRAFYRAVFECCLEPLFGGRLETVKAELLRRDVLLSTPGKSSAGQGSLARRMDQLRSEWNIKLEKETRDSEIRERVRHAREEVIISPAPLLPVPSRQPIKKRTSRPVVRSEVERRRIIFGAIQAGLEGQSYCRELDSKHLLIPSKWRELGCPATYVAAYRASGWQKRIQDEKYRWGKKYKT